MGHTPPGTKELVSTLLCPSAIGKGCSQGGIQVPRYPVLSVWRESSSGSLRSLCQQRGISTGNREGTPRRSVHSVGRDAQGRGRRSHSISRGSLSLLFPLPPARTHSFLSASVYSDVTGSTYLIYPSLTPPSPDLVTNHHL